MVAKPFITSHCHGRDFLNRVIHSAFILSDNKIELRPVSPRVIYTTSDASNADKGAI